MSHPHPPSRPGARLAIALALTLLFVLVEAGAGWWSGSLALLSDAGHNLTDALALLLAGIAAALSARPANARRTYGYHRSGILAALVNSAGLILVAGWILIEAFRRLADPQPVMSGMLIGVGLLAVLVNAGTAWLVSRGSSTDLNLRAAFVHLMGDVFSTIGAVIAGVLIALTGWNWLDPLVSALIAGLILWNGWGILRETLDILLESAPRDLDLRALEADLRGLPGVRGVHDLHLWSITRALRTLSAHIVLDDMPLSAGAQVRAGINTLLAERYGIRHATLQLECADCPGECACELTGAQAD